MAVVERRRETGEAKERNVVKPSGVVLVDDEEMILASIKNLLILETDYEIAAYSSPREALEFIGARGADLVISDYLMPEMDGIAFLARVKEIQPQAVRVLLTGYADKENAIKAINDVGLFQYIEKPWDNEDLKLVIRNGLERRTLLRRFEEQIVEVEKAHAALQELQKEILKSFA